MQGTILNKPIELQISTITISNVDNTNINLFRCTLCGGAVAQYQGHVVKIYPNLEPYYETLVIQQCHQCGARYTFQSQIRQKSKPTKIILKTDPLKSGVNTFFCFTCRQPILAYTLTQFADINKKKEVKLPYEMKCPTETCPASYRFTEVV